MTTAAADALRDEELSGTRDDVIKTAILERLKDVHTALPGIIKSFDPAKQTAVVQPAIKRIWVDDGPLDLPQCLDVPVHFPRGGAYVLTLPVAAGDECLLCFGERAIDNWFSAGGSQEPSEFRMHDLSDAFAFVGFSSLKQSISNLATDAAELRTLDGSTVFRLEQSTAYVGGKAGSEKSVMGETYRTAEDALFAALNVFTAALAGAFNPVSTPADCVAALQTVGKAAAPLISQLATFKAAATAYLAKKAKVS